MKLNDVMMSLIKATITIEALQTIGGFLITETNRDDFSEEFVQQVMHQCAAQHYSPFGDNDMDKTLEFEIPVGHVCYIAQVIGDVAQVNPNAKDLMPDWKPFVRAAKVVVDDALMQGPERRHDELGPESLN